MTDDDAARRRALVRDALRFACLGGGLSAGAVALLGPPKLAISIVLGTLVGVLNFVMLARGVAGAIDRTVAEVERTQQARAGEAQLEPEDVVGRPRGAGGAGRMAVILVLVVGLLFYGGMQPLGLVIGVVITLVAGSLAAWRRR